MAFLAITFASGFLVDSCNGQQTFGSQYLKLIKEIPLPDVKGRIDHMDIDLKAQIIYLSDLGNNSLKIIDLQKGKVIQSIAGLSEPQGVVYIPEYDEIFVANGGNGNGYFYNTTTLQRTASIHLPSDADDVRYDSLSGKIYVGYGEGGIAVIDAGTRKQINDFLLPVHPESFQLDKPAGKIFVNLPDAHTIGIIDLQLHRSVKEWKTYPLSANFPMALDTIHHRLFIGYRKPARLVVLDSRSGKTISVKKMAGDADDLYYDEASERIYVSGGGGYINIFKQQDADRYQQIANIRTRIGARTSFLVSSLHVFLVAERETGDKEARLMVYDTGP